MVGNHYNDKQPAPASNRHLSPGAIDRLLATQERELELRSEELDLRRQYDSNNFEWAKATLSAQAKDRDAERGHSLKHKTRKHIFICIVSVIFLGFLGYALYIGKEQVALEIIKLAIVFVGGGAGGYAYCIFKQSKTADE